MTVDDALTIWVIYKRPSDFPDVPFVARAQRAMPDGTIVADPDHFEGDTLQEVRDMLPFGLTNISRLPEDEDHIVECWI